MFSNATCTLLMFDLNVPYHLSIPMVFVHGMKNKGRLSKGVVTVYAVLFKMPFFSEGLALTGVITHV